MRSRPPTARHGESLRDVGLAMAKGDVNIIPILDDAGAVAGILTTRDLARRYIKESSEPSSFADRPASADLIVEVLGGTMLVPPHPAAQRAAVGRHRGRGDDGQHDGAERHRGGRQPRRRPAAGGRDRRRAGRLAVRLRARRGGARAMARAAGTGVVLSPLDSYVTGRLVSLSVPVREVMSPDPLVVDPDDLWPTWPSGSARSTTAPPCVVDEAGGARRGGDPGRAGQPRARARCCSWTTPSRPRASPGSAEASIVEILDHHHIGSIETRFPVAATFDPVGSTATLVVERFRARTGGSRSARPPRCCWPRSCPTRSS